MKSTPPLSMSDAAELLGAPWNAQKLRRYVLSRERATGRTILVRVGNGSLRPTYRVAVPALRRWCPELFEEPDPGQRAASALASRVLRRLDDIAEQGEEIVARQGSIANSIGRIAGTARKS